MTKRLSFLLLDANIIIELWRLGLWSKLVELCDIHVGKTVVGEAKLLSLPSDWRLCSADGIVFKVLANVQRGEQGISLEEVLGQVGISRRLSKQYTKEFRTEKRKLGAIDSLQNRGRKA